MAATPTPACRRCLPLLQDSYSSQYQIRLRDYVSGIGAGRPSREVLNAGLLACAEGAAGAAAEALLGAFPRSEGVTRPNCRKPDSTGECELQGIASKCTIPITRLRVLHYAFLQTHRLVIDAFRLSEGDSISVRGILDPMAPDAECLSFAPTALG